MRASATDPKTVINPYSGLRGSPVSILSGPHDMSQRRPALDQSARAAWRLALPRSSGAVCLHPHPGFRSAIQNCPTAQDGVRFSAGRHEQWSRKERTCLTELIFHTDAQRRVVRRRNRLVLRIVCKALARTILRARRQSENRINTRHVFHAVLGESDRSDLARVRTDLELHIATLGFAGMGLKVFPKSPSKGVDAPTKLVRFGKVVTEVDHRRGGLKDRRLCNRGCDAENKQNPRKGQEVRCHGCYSAWGIFLS